MSVSDIITYIMLFFSLIGAADRAIGCRFGPGKAFEKGFQAAGALILAMIGPVALAPAIAAYVAPVVSPVFRAVGIDPSVISGLLIANDSGGWPLALALAEDEAVGRLSGSVMGSTMGCAIMFALPMTFTVTPSDRRPAAAKGLAIGLITLPIANLVSGLLFDIPLPKLLINLLPLIVFAGIFIIGLIFFEPATIKIITVMGYVLTAVITAALAAAMAVKVTGMKLENFGSYDEGILIMGSIVIFLSGAFTILALLEKYCGGFFEWAGKKLGMDRTSVLGLLTSTINAIPMFSMTKDMNDRGVTVNMAYLLPASFLIGDHLAFQLTADPSTTLPFLIGKIAGGAAAVALAMAMTGKKADKSETEVKKP